MEKTILYGGATYTWYGFDTGKSITFAAVHKNGIVFHVEQSMTPNQIDKKFNMSEISSGMWARSGILTAWAGNNWDYGISYFVPREGWVQVQLATVDGRVSTTDSNEWAFNKNTNLIPTTFVKDGTKVTMTCKDYNGKTWSYTFNTW